MAPSESVFSEIGSWLPTKLKRIFNGVPPNLNQLISGEWFNRSYDAGQQFADKEFSFLSLESFRLRPRVLK